MITENLVHKIQIKNNLRMKYTKLYAKFIIQFLIFTLNFIFPILRGK